MKIFTLFLFFSSTFTPMNIWCDFYFTRCSHDFDCDFWLWLWLIIPSIELIYFTYFTYLDIGIKPYLTSMPRSMHLPSEDALQINALKSCLAIQSILLFAVYDRQILFQLRCYVYYICYKTIRLNTKLN